MDLSNLEQNHDLVVALTVPIGVILIVAAVAIAWIRTHGGSRPRDE